MAHELMKRPAAFVTPFDRLFDSLLMRQPFTGAFERGLLDENALELDVAEDDEQLIVRASVPGFAREDITIDLQDGVLTISATKSEETEERRERFHRRERRTGSVSRRIALPVAVDEDSAQATLRDGVLELRLPKNGVNGPRRIAIS
ncbi:MAG: Hsp20/alpha crystallin family protein [Phycisphaerales bacterium]